MQSYVTMRNFLLWGNGAPVSPGLASRARWSAVSGPGNQTVFPSTFYPRLDKLGETASKAFLADSSRFLSFDGTIDHDVALLSTFGGMYSDGGPTQPEVFLRSYFINPPLRDYAYRHAHGETPGLNVAFFDGHVSWMGEALSRHPRWWWPPSTAIPQSEMNYQTLQLVFEEMLQSPDFKYHVP
jgi:prepilin-type processing-associated H-X9-DG protein